MSAQYINMVENQSIKLPLKSIKKHVQGYNMALRAKNKLKKTLLRNQRQKFMVGINIFFKNN